MAAKKFGADRRGRWERDVLNLPNYRLDRDAVDAYSRPYVHLLGGGGVSLLADQGGVVRLLPKRLARPVWCGDLLVHLRLGATEIMLLPNGAGTGDLVSVSWGCGYIRYEWSLGGAANGPQTLIALTISAPVNQPFLQLDLVLENTQDTTLTAKVLVAIPIQSGTDHAAALFTRDGIAIAGKEDGTRDSFLAGNRDWLAQEHAPALQIATEFALGTGARQTVSAIFGSSKNCSAMWLREQLGKIDAADFGSTWQQVLASRRQQGAELWMHEECVWTVARTLSFLQPASVPNGHARLAPLGDVNSTRALSHYAPPLFPWMPDAALAQLKALAASQNYAGRLPEIQGLAPAAFTDARTERSDLEIGFILAWCDLVDQSADSALLDLRAPFSDAEEASIWEHLMRACAYIRDDIGCGFHGLVRILAGDSCSMLNRVGVDGAGESVLNTAMLCTGLRQLTDIARERGEMRIADDLEQWRRKLHVAVSGTYSGRGFARAYTDLGRPLGLPPAEGLFTDVQAWAVLARCGTAEQRKNALDAVLEAGNEALPAPALTKPLPAIPPTDVSSCVSSAGRADNGGISLAVTMWLIKALVAENRRPEAMKEWQKMTLRARSDAFPELGAAALAGAECLNGPAAGQASGQPACADALPHPGAVAWQDLALRHILD